MRRLPTVAANRGWVAPTLPVVLSALIAPAFAQDAPPPPCEGVIEAGMMVGGPFPLGGATRTMTGVTVESYRNAEGVPAPVPQLDGVDGTRVTHCASGRFYVVNGVDPVRVNDDLSANISLSAAVADDMPAGNEALVAAFSSLYPSTLFFDDSSQTCGCAQYFPDLLPEGATPFSERTDLE